MLYPSATPSRFVENLSGIWNFKLDDGTGLDAGWQNRPLEDATTMPVPASYNDLKEGVDFRDHYGWVFYQRSIAVPAFVRDQRLMLRFSAVTHHAKVYLNGELICEHKGGFLPFEVQLNDVLRDGDNLLTVAVSNVIDYTTLPVGSKGGMMGDLMGSVMGGDNVEPKKRNDPNFDFFNYAGITRPVYIYTTPQTHIEDITVVSAVNGSTATLTYEVEAAGEDAACTVELLDAAGNKVAESTGATGTLVVEDARPWNPGAPYLYTVKATYGEDVYELPYGIRTVRVEGAKFLINEKPFYFKGYGKHEDTFPAGRGENMPMNVKDISLMKWQGANSFRTSHYPYSEEMLDLCDREGILIIDEAPAVGLHSHFSATGMLDASGDHKGTWEYMKTADHHQDVIRDMVARDKNHPCVILWSVANEPASEEEGAKEYFEPLLNLVRKEDPQHRPATLVTYEGSSPEKCKVAELCDVLVINRYRGWYDTEGKISRRRRPFEE